MTQTTREYIEEVGPQYPDLDRSLAALAADGVLARLDAGEVRDVAEWFARAQWAARAGLYKALAVADRYPVYGGAPMGAVTQFACVLHLSERAAEAYVAQARALSGYFPGALRELAGGRVQGTQVRAVVECTVALDDAGARAVQERVLSLMSRQDPTATRTFLRRAVLGVDPEGARRRAG